MNREARSQPLPSAAPGEERVSLLVGDRLCIGCGYNLTGQPVVREAHYRMLIVRCPECGMVACLQEYPVLGRWAGRWAALLAALWLIVVLAMLIGSGGLLVAMASGVGASAAAPWAEAIAARHLDDLKAQAAQAPVSQMTQYMLQEGATRHSMLQRRWLDGQDLVALLDAAGGWRAVTDAGALLSWFVVALVAFPLGCIGAVALLHVPRRRLPMVALAPVLMAGVFLAIAYARSTSGWQGWVPAFQAARPGAALPYEVATLVFALLPLAAGLLLGRPVVRGLVRALLPPRLRWSLALLWTVDGLSLPTAGGPASPSPR